MRGPKTAISAARAVWVRAVLAVIASLVCASALAAEPRSTDKASSGAFTGIALVTDDPNWFELFRRPETPEISGKDSFRPGERGVIAVLFSNAEPENGRVAVSCEITAYEPDGTSSRYAPGPCYDGPALPDNVLYPTALDLQFTVGPNDQNGLAGFRIVLRDLNGGQSVALDVSFMQDTAR